MISLRYQQLQKEAKKCCPLTTKSISSFQMGSLRSFKNVIVSNSEEFMENLWAQTLLPLRKQCKKYRQQLLSTPGETSGAQTSSDYSTVNLPGGYLRTHLSKVINKIKQTLPFKVATNMMAQKSFCGLFPGKQNHLDHLDRNTERNLDPIITLLRRLG